MKRILATMALGASLLALSAPLQAQTSTERSLQMYWIDVEGGAATLFISPSGESLFLDTGYPGNGDRDAKRIHAAARRAGLEQIDHVVISHWHGDHVGGLAALAKMIPIVRFYDHGDGVEPQDRQRLDDYKAIAGNNRTILKPGDIIPFGAARFTTIVSEGPVIANPIHGGGPNALCTNAALQGPAGPENQRMVGLALTYGHFKFAALGDLDWEREMELACPVNKLGSLTLYQVNRHGGLDNSGAPALLGAIRPQVIVVNNGPRKGLGARDDRVQVLNAATATPYERNAYLRMKTTPGVEDIWQGHRSLLDNDPNHNAPPDLIANLEEGAEDQGHWIHAAVAPDGRYVLTNGRNGFSKTYIAR